MSQREFVTVQDILTSSGLYPDRAKSSEVTQEVLDNAKDLADRVNALLNEIGWQEKVFISSGFRTSASNASVKNAAKRSSHMLGKALDIRQSKPGNKLGELIRKTQNNQGKKGILGKHGLMMESLEATVGKNTNWVHLDTVVRSERPSMEFKP